jgi:hypothetical protein
MARFGFVGLVFDTVGQDERGISTRDHRRVAAYSLPAHTEYFGKLLRKSRSGWGRSPIG